MRLPFDVVLNDCDFGNTYYASYFVIYIFNLNRRTSLKRCFLLSVVVKYSIFGISCMRHNVVYVFTYK